jgi:hypothetical protein
MNRIADSKFELAQMEKNVSWARQNIKTDEAELKRLRAEEQAENDE